MILELLSSKTGVSQSNLKLFINSASHRYKTYMIPKKTGGVRQISQPSKELKLLQRIIVENILLEFPVHQCVFSYKKGENIFNNASKHVHNNYLLRIDFKDFFHSIKWIDIVYFFNKSEKKFSKDDVIWLSKILCRNLAITMGAPSSPMLSNIILYDFDCEVERRANEKEITYTRYADDIFLSSNKRNVLEDFLDEVKLLLKNEGIPKLIINDKKTIFTSRKRKKVVTGLVLTSDKKVSIGRNKKRLIKSMVFKYGNNALREDEKSLLKGQLSYIKSVEPLFITSLNNKFGDTLIETIMKS